MKTDRMRHAHNNPKHIHYAQGLGNGNGNSQADDLPQVHVISKINGLNHEHNHQHQHQHPLDKNEFKALHGIDDVDESIAAVAQPHESILVPPPPIVSSPYGTFAETKATELTLSTLIGLLVFLVPILVTLSLFVHRLATGTVPNPYHIPSTTTHGSNTRRSIPRTDSSIRTARIKKEDGWSQDEEVEDGGGASISSSSTGGDSCSISSTCMRQQPVDYGTALDGREDVISLTNNQGRSSSLSATKNLYWGESGARLRKTQNTKGNGVVVGGGGGGGGGDYQMYSSRSSSPDRTSMLFTTSSMEDSPVTRRSTMRHSNLTGGATATTTKGSTSTIAAITPSTTREEDPELDIGLGLDGFGMYNRSISIDSESDDCTNNNNSREMQQQLQQQQLRMRRTSNRNLISTSASSSTASSPILVPPHQPQHLNLNQDSFDKNGSPKAFQLSSTSYSSSSWNEQTPIATSTSHTPLSTNKKSIQSSRKSSTSTRKERNVSLNPSDSPPFLPPFSPQVVVPNKSNNITDAERNLPRPPLPPKLPVPPPLSRLSPKARRQKTEELLPRLEKSTHDIQMGDGTDYYSSDVSGGGEDDGTSSSIASVYSVEPSNPVNDDMYLSTPLISNMKEEVGMDLTANADRMKQMVSIPSLEGNVDDDKDKVSPGHTKNESIEPIVQIESKTTCSSSSTNWMDVNALASPRSISVDELKLQKMESGLISPESLEYRAEWRTAIKPRNGLDAVNEVDPILDDISKAQGEKGGNQDDRHDTGELSTGETEGANGILHKRKDLTACSDAASSLRSSIAYKELKMKKLIGGGGFGQVHEATWRGTPVAVKVLAASSQAENVQKAILQEFAAEINMVSGMRHPNICLYIGACLEHPNRCIVTELAANGSLWDALRQTLKPPYQSSDGLNRNGWPSSLYKVSSPQKTSSETATFFAPLPDNYAWPWILVRRVAAGAARGMNYLHCGHPAVLHRDLKSANILLDDSYNAKVCDFGLSRLKAQERSMTGNCGTVQWMAPEILANQHYAEPADVYSYGIILWELLSRECPYEGMSPIQCALAVLNQDLRPTIPEWCPPAFGVLIKNCIDKDPNARPTFENILCILDSM